MNDFLMAFVIVFGYGAAGFGILYLCWLFVDSLYSEEDNIENFKEEIIAEFEGNIRRLDGKRDRALYAQGDFTTAEFYRGMMIGFEKSIEISQALFSKNKIEGSNHHE